jgi:hypothetical protein
MPTSTTTLYLDGIAFEVEFDWSEYEAETYYTPEAGGFECINKVIHQGEDIIDFLSSTTIEQLETKIIDHD